MSDVMTAKPLDLNLSQYAATQIITGIMHSEYEYKRSSLAGVRLQVLSYAIHGLQ